MDERIDITLDDVRKPGNEMFANLVDPVLLSIFIKRVMDVNEKKSLAELVKDLLEGK